MSSRKRDTCFVEEQTDVHLSKDRQLLDAVCRLMDHLATSKKLVLIEGRCSIGMRSIEGRCLAGGRHLVEEDRHLVVEGRRLADDMQSAEAANMCWSTCSRSGHLKGERYEWEGEHLKRIHLAEESLDGI